MDIVQNIANLVDIFNNANRIVFFSGAGVSTESGIPDFRSADGIYANSQEVFPAEYLLSHSCFTNHTEQFYQFYREKMLYPDAEPNPAHLVMAKLEAAGKASAVVTQNIDGLHQKAGFKNVLELHGSVLRNYCVSCGARYDLGFILATDAIPKCTKCSGIVRPDVVLYEEILNHQVIEKAQYEIRNADVLVVGGTSLNVYPAAGFVGLFPGENLVLINKSATQYDQKAKLVIREPIGEVLNQVAAKMGL